MKSKDFAELVARLTADKRAEKVAIIDLRKFSAPADFYVVATANSEPHLKGIADYLENELRKSSIVSTHRDGIRGSEWLVLDFFDVIVHLFSGRKREYYAIEELYADAPITMYVPEDDEPKAVKAAKRPAVRKKAVKAVKEKKAAAKPKKSTVKK
ncbi:MAG: ribosome silencing factor [Fibrobacteres bacterium]|nr:ribosome silencing factor [Fibrobacterota bacterium]